MVNLNPIFQGVAFKLMLETIASKLTQSILVRKYIVSVYFDTIWSQILRAMKQQSNI